MAMRLLVASTRDARSSGCGARGFTKNVSGAWTNSLARVAPGLSPPEIVIQVRALACELPSTHGIPLSRWVEPSWPLKCANRGWWPVLAE